MEYIMYYLIFTVGTIFGACCMTVVNYNKNNVNNKTNENSNS